MTLPESSQSEAIRQQLLALHQFPDDSRIVLYRRSFAQALPRLAPDTMADLLRLAPLAMEWARQEYGTDEREAAKMSVVGEVTRWCRQWNMDAEWVLNAGLLTVVTAALNQKYGQDVLDKFVTSAAPTVVEVDDELYTWLEEVEIHPVADIAIHVRSDPYHWKPLEETRAQFRERAQAEFLSRLDEEISISRDVADITPINVNHHWVEWLILKRVRKESVNAIARSYGGEFKDIRKTVRDGISQAQAILFPRPPRDGDCTD